LIEIYGYRVRQGENAIKKSLVYREPVWFLALTKGIGSRVCLLACLLLCTRYCILLSSPELEANQPGSTAVLLNDYGFFIDPQLTATSNCYNPRAPITLRRTIKASSHHLTFPAALWVISHQNQNEGDKLDVELQTKGAVLYITFDH